MRIPERRVLIVGAGVSGLACAQYLQCAHPQVRAIVLEARQRPGGRVYTHWLDHPDPQPHLPPAPAADITHPSTTSEFAQTSLENPQADYSIPLDPLAAPVSTPASTFPNPNFSSSFSFAPAPAMANGDTGYPQTPICRPKRLDFHQLVSGALHPTRTTSEGHQRVPVDIGASIMHGCGDENQIVFKRAIKEKIRAPVVAGGGFYESTEHALWYDCTNGKRIPFSTVVDLHNIFFMASRYMAAVASQNDDGMCDIESVFDCGVNYVCGQLNRVFNSVELSMLRKIAARSVGYCAPMRHMALMQAGAGMEPAGADAIIGVPYEEDDPPFPGEVPSMSPSSIQEQASRIEENIIASQNVPYNCHASQSGGNGDRIVLDGYTPFLIDKLCVDVDIRYGKIVNAISKGFCAPKTRGHYNNATAVGSQQTTRFSWDNDPDVASRTVFVSTRCGDVYDADIVVVTTPLGVLKRSFDDGGIKFSPPLSDSKLEAIHGMGMGIHNKVVLRFSEGNIFWPVKLPQLNCTDSRFQFFNLNAYGKPGVLLVHVFAESGFAAGFWNLSDTAVLFEIMMVLGGMFCGGLESDRAASGRARLSKLLLVCENCRKDREEGEGAGHGCPHCAHISGDSAPVEEEANTENGIVESKFIEGNKKVQWDNLPLPEEYLVTRWDEDPFAFGSYSYMPCGSNWTMIDNLAASEPRNSANPYLYFAGEHCSDLGWQCLHGAYETGVRVAKEILVSFGIPDALKNGTSDIMGNNVEGNIGVGNEASDNIGDIANKENGDIGATVEGGTNKSNGFSSQKLEAVVGDELKGDDVGDTRKVTENGVGRDMSQGSSEEFWTEERDRALTRALTGYSDVYGNVDDVVDEIAHALETFKKEPTQLGREIIRQMVRNRTTDRANGGDQVARSFMKFHKEGEDEMFPKPFEEVHRRPRMIGLNGSKLKEYYSEDIVTELNYYARLVAENQISYRETLRKIAMKIYKKDGGLMTKRCLSEYLRTQEFGTGPQKELYLEKFLPNRPKPAEPLQETETAADEADSEDD